jgi:DNA-binding transcriptional ArsR family regulator
MVSTPRQIEALANPLRARIIRHAGRPVTVAELAERLDVPATRLYYHVNLLVEEGLLVQVDQRKSGARIERIYLRTAGDFQLDPGLAEAVGDRREAARLAASLVLEPARTEIEEGLERMLAGEQLGGELSRSVIHLTPADAARFGQQLGRLTRDVIAASNPDDPGASPFALTTAFLPIEPEAHPRPKTS